MQIVSFLALKSCILLSWCRLQSFPKDIDKLHANTKVVRIFALVTKSKAAHLDKLIKINEANVVRLAQEKYMAKYWKLHLLTDPKTDCPSPRRADS